MKAGIYRERVKDECVLDVLLESEKLGWPENSMRRYDAGIWLRQLYLKTHDEQGVSSYQRQSIHGTGELSAQLKWNTQCYYETAIALKPHWRRLYAVCCENKLPQQRTLWATIDALDALADHRHIT